MSSLRTVLISGANQGLGYETSLQLAKTGKYRILLGCRSEEKGRAAVEQMLAAEPSIPAANLEVVELDIQSDESVDAAVAAVGGKYGALDILVNSAGSAHAPSSVQGGPRAEWAYLMDLNVASHSIMTEKFTPLLKASKDPERRVVFVTSGLGSLGLMNDKSHPFYSVQLPLYRSSKAAFNMLSNYYAKAFEAEKIGVVTVCPGHCATAFNNYRGTDTPETGAAAIVKAATEGTMEGTRGRFITKDEDYPW